ncbi:MAG TPA: alginate lyase family protein [Pirellulales bacterium]
MLRFLGPRVVRLRAGVHLNKALGTSRRQFPPRSWESINLDQILRPGTPTESTPFATFKREQRVESFFPLGEPPVVPEWMLKIPAQRQPTLAERLRLIAADRCVYFFHTSALASVDWNENPFDHKHSFPDRTWFEIPDYLPEQGDMRLMWEPSRAQWAIDLARARSHGMEIESGNLYWRWLESWMAGCPPWRGFQWKCGQESFVRLLSLVIGFWSLADDPATTPARWTHLARLAWATGYRIDHHITYAQSQKNNHALCEACGLMLVGHLFPELREADHWFERGRKIFSQELAGQMYADGSYLQHSLNYHRVMLQTGVIAALVAKWHGQPLDGSTIQHIAAAEEFLFQMLDPETGRVPLYGNNDGAWVLPLNECDYSDFRGAVQAAHFLTNNRRRFAPGPWDEDLLWLFGPQALDAAQQPLRKPKSTAFRDGGYFTLQGSNSWGMIRCHTYRDRPGQYDPMHFDLWHQGQNVLRDCGTYEYFPPEGRAMEDYFQLIRSHNTVEIDRDSPVERVSRFLYFPWPRATARRFETQEPGFRYFEGESRDYDRRPWHVLHRRAILGLDSDAWLIVDDLFGQGRHTAILRWHLTDMPVTLDQAAHKAVLSLDSGDWTLSVCCSSGKPWDRLEIIRGRNEPGSIQGFASPYYGERISIPVLEAEITAEFPLRLLTIAAPGKTIQWQAQSVSVSGEHYELRANNRAWDVELGPLERRSERTIVQVRTMDPDVEPSVDHSTPSVSGAVFSGSGR